MLLFLMFIYLILPPRSLLYATLRNFLKNTVLDTTDQNVNEMYDFAGHVFRVGDIIACAPREL